MVKEMAFVVYPVNDMERSVAFYRDTVGLTPGEQFSDRWVEFEVGNGTFGIVTGAEEVGVSAGSQFTVAFEVDDIKAERARLETAGVPVSEIMESPVCFNVFATDPDGNRFGIHERKPKKT
jgi:predicted enzyme related to lactoylglutathione lyase